MTPARALFLMFFCSTVAFPASGSELRTDNKTGLEFAALSKGCFRMGEAEAIQPKEDFHWAHLGFKGPMNADERPVHEVCVDRFWIARTEVTAALWQRINGRLPPAGQGSEPAGGMSWEEVTEFIARLNQRAQKRYRLPTEAEWEYACRAGRQGDITPKIHADVPEAWFSLAGRRVEGASDVAKLEANPWGLFDMLGNVWELTADYYQPDAYSRHLLYNPQELRPAGRRVIRGASFRSEYFEVRCANRGRYFQDQGLPHIGVRLVWEP